MKSPREGRGGEKIIKLLYRRDNGHRGSLG